MASSARVTSTETSLLSAVQTLEFKFSKLGHPHPENHFMLYLTSAKYMLTWSKVMNVYANRN